MLSYSWAPVKVDPTPVSFHLVFLPDPLSPLDSPPSIPAALATCRDTRGGASPSPSLLLPSDHGRSRSDGRRRLPASSARGEEVEENTARTTGAAGATATPATDIDTEGRPPRPRRILDSGFLPPATSMSLAGFRSAPKKQRACDSFPSSQPPCSAVGCGQRGGEILLLRSPVRLPRPIPFAAVRRPSGRRLPCGTT
ncbi:uncharacterized protein LOC119355266 [Triticum dicoccoides]|uniref:uncharacterized protein LOC119355266 n=1 Tax=Triticum dicoccoides TaxID=85692 RepID=UPI00188E6C4E|nr:uncharacterized protein LOC119355266 [Triticum dicoccoides]XP_044326182.1 uncharacterized protein LOC123046792 [Triticum aestivum]